MQKYGFEKNKDLLCGANPHQSAELYDADCQVGYDVLGEDLSYMDICNASVACDIASEFYDVCAAVVVKNAMPVSVALGADISEAYQKAFDSNPVQAFGSTVAFTQTVTKDLAKLIVVANYDVIIAPEFEDDVLELLSSTGSKLVKINEGLEGYKKLQNDSIKVTSFGVLVQSPNSKDLEKDNFKVVTKTKPTAEQIEDAIFAWKVSKYAKSPSIVCAKNFKTVSITQACNDTVYGIENSLDFACDESKDAVLACDFPLCLKEQLEDAAQGRASLIITPDCIGNSKELIKLADKFNLSVITTKVFNTTL